MTDPILKTRHFITDERNGKTAHRHKGVARYTQIKRIAQLPPGSQAIKKPGPGTRKVPNPGEVSEKSAR